MTDIGLLVRSANPVPEDSQLLTDDELSAVLLLAQQRSGDMDTKERTETARSPRSQRRTVAVAAGAFAVVIMVVGAIALFSGSTDEVPPATTPSTTEVPTPTTEPPPPTTEAAPSTTSSTVPELDASAVALVEEWAALLNVGDHRAAAELILAADNLDVPGENDDEREKGIRDTYAIWALLGSEVDVDDCRTLSSGLTTCRIIRSTVEIEPHYPHPETTSFSVRVDGDGALLSAAVRPIQSDPWWIPYITFQEWTLDTYGTNPESPYWQLFVFTDVSIYVDVLEEQVAIWRGEQGA